MRWEDVLYSQGFGTRRACRALILGGAVAAGTDRCPVEERQIQRLRAGVVLHDDPRPVTPAAVERIDARRLHLTLTGGRYHQVKRMVAAVGNRVEVLHRTAIGPVVLPADLAPGQWRWLSESEVAALRLPAADGAGR